MYKTHHTLTINVVFDKKCSKAQALKEVKDRIHGQFFCSNDYFGEQDLEYFKVRSIKK